MDPRIPLIVGLVVLLLPAPASGQLVEIQRNGSTKVGLYHFTGRNDKASIEKRRTEESGVEVFAREGAEMFFSGIGQANIQVAKIHAGEPTGFNVPLYFFISPAGDVGGGEVKPNEVAAATLVNPLGGAVNLSLRQDHRIVGDLGKYTSLKFAYHLSGRTVTGQEQSEEGSNRTTFAGYGDAGLMFQTAAWKDGGDGKPGVLWILATAGVTVGSETDLKALFGPDARASFGHWGVHAGLEIENYINLKVGITQAIGYDKVRAFEKPLIKFAFDVTPGN